MRKFTTIIALSVLLFASCNKEAQDSYTPGEEISFSLAGEGLFSVDTRSITPTTDENLSSVYWEAQTGSTVTYPVASYSVSSGTVSTGKYWPKTSVTYKYLVANKSFTSSTGDMTVSNTEDVVAGYNSAVSSNGATITLEHIFARTGTLNATIASPFSLSNVSWKIKKSGANTGTTGTYSIPDKTWSSTSGLTSDTAITGESDIYLIPGTYTLSVTFTATSGAYTETLTKSADVTLVAGKVNNISGTVSVDASQLQFDVTVTAWGTNNINNVTFN